MKIYLLASLLLCFFTSQVSAKTKPTSIPPLPGEIFHSSGSDQVIFEQGRTLLWPSQGPLLLKGKDGKVLASVNLQTKGQKESGTEALGLEVEEVDLGGSHSTKKYLNGKKDPQGRSLGASALAGKPQAEAAGRVQSSTAEGVNISNTTYPNGATLLKFNWGDFSEEIYFDRRKTLIHNQQTRQVGPLLYTLKQFADGSFSRSYFDKSGGLTYTYDANDQSYRFAFANAKGEALMEVSCQENCSVE